MVLKSEVARLRQQLKNQKVRTQLIRDKRIAQESLAQEKKRLQRELFELQNPKKILFGKKVGGAIRRTGIKVAKVIVKQGRLIREQGQRDQAKTRKLRKGGKKIQKKVSEGFNIFGNLDF